MLTGGASLSQLAVHYSLIEEPERARLCRELSEATQAGQPSSFTRSLLKAGIPPEAVKRLLAAGGGLQEVLCDGCGKPTPQDQLPLHREAPCSQCGLLLMTFRGFEAFRKAPVTPTTQRSTTRFKEVLPVPQPEPLSPAGGLDDEAPQHTMMFKDVFVLPAGSRQPLSDDEAQASLNTIVLEAGPLSLPTPPPATAPQSQAEEFDPSGVTHAMAPLSAPDEPRTPASTVSGQTAQGETLEPEYARGVPRPTQTDSDEEKLAADADFRSAKTFLEVPAALEESSDELEGAEVPTSALPKGFRLPAHLTPARPVPRPKPPELEPAPLPEPSPQPASAPPQSAPALWPWVVALVVLLVLALLGAGLLLLQR